MRRLSLLLLLLLVPLAAGCGSEPASLQGSDDALKNASTSRVEWKLEGGAVPYWALFGSTGSIDYANDRGELVFTGNDSEPDARVVFLGRDGYLGARVGDTMYWEKQSSEDTREADRFLPGSSGMAPDRLLKDLIKASKKVDKVGSEEIRGVTTTHYRAHLDRSKLGSDANDNVPEAVDAWIDEQGLPRRVRVPYGDGNDELAAVVDLFDFGVPVDVQAPPASEIVSEDRFDKLMEKECIKVKTAKDLEHANPLCLIFGATLEPSGSDSIQIEPTETVPATGGK
jgi:hypothetical protein